MAYPIITTMQQFSGKRINKPETRALWNLSDGTWTDDSGNGYHGTFYGTGHYAHDDGILMNGSYVNVENKVIWNPAFNFKGDWELTTTHPYSGTHCYVSQNPGHDYYGAISATEFTVDVPTGSTGEIRLMYYVSTEDRYDHLRIYIDGVIDIEVDGEIPWTQYTRALTEGTHTVRLEYIRDGAGGGNDNLVYVDDIEFYVDSVLQTSENFDSAVVSKPIENMDSWTIGGWIEPTASDVSATWAMIATTRSGSGESPIFHLALNNGIPHVRIYSQNVDQVNGSNIYGESLVAGQKYFIALAYDRSTTTLMLTVNERSVEIPLLYNGANTPPTTLNSRPLSFGHMDGAYLFQGWFSGWFLEYAYDQPSDLHSFYTASRDVETVNIDYSSQPGSILLKQEGGRYVSEGTYISPVVDLQNPFPELGMLQIKGNAPYGYTVLVAETRTSADGINFSDWLVVDSAGRIQSPNYRHIQVRLTLKSNDGARTPLIEEITFEDTSPQAVVNVVKVIPKVYDNNDKLVANLNKLESAILEDANNGDETMTFGMKYTQKAKELFNEFRVDIEDEKGNPYNRFYIRDITDSVSAEGQKIREFHCEAAWYDLATKPKIANLDFRDVYPDEPLKHVVAGTGWTVGVIDPGFELRDYVVEKKQNPLKHIRGIQEVWGGDIVFDNVNKQVSLLNKNIDTGYSIRRRKNMKSIKRNINTQGLVTKLFPYGANGVTIAPANNNVPYLENYSWFTDRGMPAIVKEADWTDNRFHNIFHLKEKGVEKLAEWSRPTVSYEIEILDLSVLPKFSHEIPDLRTQALIEEEDLLNELVPVKIVSRKLDLLQPWKSKLQLSTKIKELGDEGAAIGQEGEGRLDNADAVDKTEIQDMMIFNYLQNSRADSGLNYWTPSGNIYVDSLNGVSNHNSFKIVGGGAGTKQELNQTVYPSTRDNYTFSAYIAAEDLVKHQDAKVGIKVVVNYEDGTSEEQFIEL